VKSSQIGFASLYDAQFQDYNHDLPFWLGLVERFGDPVLELGCGTARVLVPVLESGAAALGIDRDLAMLEIAQSRVSGSTQLKSHAGSLACMDLLCMGLQTQFALAIAPLNTLATVDDAGFIQILLQLSGLLQPHAALACELPNPSTALDPDHNPDDVLDTFMLKGGELGVQVQARTPAPKPGVQRVDWTYSILHPEGEVERVELKEDYYLRTPEELAGLCKAAGFSAPETYGDYDLQSYDETSPRLLVVLHRVP